MKPVKACLTSILLIASVCAFTQTQIRPPVIEWQKSLGGSRVDRANTVIRTLDNGYLVAGKSFSNDGQVTGHHGSTDSSDAWIVKLDASGNIQWQRSVGGTRNDEFSHVLQAGNGDFLCVGTTESVNGDVSGLHGTLQDVWICRMSSTGELLWSRVYGGTDPDFGRVIRNASDGGYIVGADAVSPDGDITNHIGWSDIWIIKINEAGDIQWQKKYGTTNDQFTNDLVVTYDGGYAIAAYQRYRGSPSCMSPMYAYYQDARVKIDKNGNVQWEQYGTFSCGNPGFSRYTYNLLQMPGGELFGVNQDLLATGGSSPGLGTWGFARYSAATGAGRGIIYEGSYSFANTYLEPASQGTAPNSSVVLPDSSILSTAQITAVGNTSNGGFQGSITRINTKDTLNRLTFDYQARYGGTNADLFRALDVLNEREFIAAGYSNSNNGDVSGNHGDYDFWVVKFSTLNKIKGRVYIDANGNGIKDAGENYYPHLKVTSSKTGKAYASTTDLQGLFLNNVDTGNFTTTVNLLKPYYTITPASKVTNFTTYNNKDSFDFALVPIPGFNDLKVTLSALSALRPGFNAQYSLKYANQGTEPINDVIIKLVVPSNMNFVLASPAQTTIVNDTIIWNVGTVASLTSGTLQIVLQADPPPGVSIGDMIRLIGIVEPVAGDHTPTDNRDTLRQTATGSYDPNDKIETVGGRLAPSQLNDDVTYTIRFQNTGNDTAFNIVIRDTLDSKLNVGSIEMIAASHPFHLHIKDGNKLAWTFTDIKLEDSNRNEPASHGYITYRITPKATLALGDTIKNRASIYFDFNPPVETNTARIVITSFALPVRMTKFEGVLNNGVVTLSWKTATEQSTKQFDVERSTDGLNYSKLGTVQASGIATGSNYDFKDNAPASGYNYYRLRIIDEDGMHEHSTVVIINSKKSNKLNLFIYPNPTPNGQITLNISGKINGECTLDVLDMNGRKVLGRSLGVMNAEGYTTPVSLNGLQKGVYFLRLSVGTEQLMHRVVIQ